LAGSAAAARLTGQSWRDSLIIGTLMNTRGLMELVVLNIGYELGVLSPEVFAMMVIMALVTTFMTGPALDLIEKLFPEKAASYSIRKHFNILISFGNPEAGKAMLRLSAALIGLAEKKNAVTALHLSSVNEVKLYNEENLEKEIFKPIRIESKKLGITTSTIYNHSHDFTKDIIETANEGKFSLLLIGMGQSLFKGSVLGRLFGAANKIIKPDSLMDTISGKEKLFEEYYFDDRVKQICKSTNIPVGILIDKGLQNLDNVFMPIISEGDDFLLYYAKKLIRNNNTKISCWNKLESKKLNDLLTEYSLSEPANFLLKKQSTKPETYLNEQSIAIVSIDTWKKLIDEEDNLLSHLSSVLILKS
jgi:hypothetical protein